MSKRKLLLADDSITIQKVVNLTFADEGIDVITVGDGDSAMAKIWEAVPDVILADVHMPGLSGYQVCEMVRSNEATRELPVVLLVGSFEPFDEDEAARVGANAFLTKPFQSIRQLVSQVSDLMQASAPAEPAETAAIPADEHGDATPSGYATSEENVDNTVPTNVSDTSGVPTSGGTRARDTSDIDRLYSQSVGAGPSDLEAGSSPPTYVDAGMDDEMIETVHAVDDQAEEEEFYHEPTAEYQQLTHEYEIEPTGFHEPVAGHEQQAENRQQPVEEYRGPAADHQPPVEEYRDPVDDHQYPVNEYAAPTEQRQQPVAEYAEPTAEYQQPVDDYREPVAEYHSPTPDYEKEPVFEEIAPHTASPFDAPADVTSVNEPELQLDPYASTQPVQQADATSEFSLDEANLLELPPMAGGKTIEFTTRPTAEGGKEVVSLSPELMDALVEKVVKQLSKKE